MTAFGDVLDQALTLYNGQADALAACQVDYAALQTDAAATKAELADAKNALATVQAALAAAPKMTRTVFGVATEATPSRQAAWDASGGAVGATLLRCYDSGDPTTWAAGSGAKVTGPSVFISSEKNDVAGTIGGVDDAHLTTYAKSIPPGRKYLASQLEPENKTKNITPADYGAEWERWAGLIRAGAPMSVKVGGIFMTDTVNDRTDIPRGTNPWMAALLGRSQRPDFIGLDGYSRAGTGWRDAEAIFGRSVAYIRSLFGDDIEIIAAEWGQDIARAATRPQWIRDTCAYFVGEGFTLASYFNVHGTTGDYRLDAAGLAALKEATQ